MRTPSQRSTIRISVEQALRTTALKGTPLRHSAGRCASATLLAFAIVGSPALAQDVRTKHSHDDGAEIIVSAPIRQSERDVLSGTTIMTGEKLERDLRSTIGETLARQPGVSASSFGPNASRPILRGFQGERVRVLSDGIGSIDVSNTSADHAVIIDPLLADRVEVMRGPAALLFGSSAAGGVVNVIDKRIPRIVPEKGYSFDGLASYGSAAGERSVAGSANVAAGPHFVLNANGSYHRSDDLRIGGPVLSASARAAALAAAAGPTTVDDPDFAATAGLRGRLPNSAAETWTAGVGGAVAADTANVGLAFSHYDSLYGVPIRYATASGQGQESPRLSIVQNRIDLRADIGLTGFFDRLRVRGAYAAYRHYELKETGDIATTFKSKGIEGRVELVQGNRSGWTGASGVQYLNRDFNVAGDEAFLPNNLTSQIGFFTLQQYDRGPVKFEVGLRYERSDLRAAGDGISQSFFEGRRAFDALSGSAGVSYAVATDVRAGLNVSRTERAPSAEELFANGPHGGTQAWELGNANFGTEKAWTVEATLHVHKPGFGLDASVYHSWFSDYISEDQVDQGVCETAAAPSARTVDLPCFQFRQGKARYYGVEADMTVLLGQAGPYAINLDLVGDYVHASGRSAGVADNRPLPRIPPARILGGLEAQSDRLTARAEVEHAFAQDRIARFDTRTDDYTMVNASVSWRPVADNSKFSLLLSGNNLFNVEARRASSVLKDYAPLAGRDIRVTARVGF